MPSGLEIAKINDKSLVTLTLYCTSSYPKIIIKRFLLINFFL